MDGCRGSTAKVLQANVFLATPGTPRDGRCATDRANSVQPLGTGCRVFPGPGYARGGPGYRLCEGVCVCDCVSPCVCVGVCICVCVQSPQSGSCREAPRTLHGVLSCRIRSPLGTSAIDAAGRTETKCACVRMRSCVCVCVSECVCFTR